MANGKAVLSFDLSDRSSTFKILRHRPKVFFGS